MYSKATQTAKTVKRKVKALSFKKIVKQLDDAVRDYLKTLPDECVCCGATNLGFWDAHNNPTGLQAGHFIDRKKYSLRWDLKNVHRQCSGCNLIHRTNPLPYTKFMVRRYGVGVFDYLESVQKSHVKFSRSQLLEKLEKLKELCKK